MKCGFYIEIYKIYRKIAVVFFPRALIISSLIYIIYAYSIFYVLGKEVSGEYTVKEPGGNIRTVKYHADKSGFHAHVHNSGGNDHSGGGSHGHHDDDGRK